MINLNELTMFEDSKVFKLEQFPTRSYEKDYVTQMDITIEMNLNQLIIERVVYSSLDFLSDIGGVLSILVSTGAIFCAVWNYRHLENYMVSRLFKLQTENYATSVHQSGAQSDYHIDGMSRFRDFESLDKTQRDHHHSEFMEPRLLGK